MQVLVHPDGRERVLPTATMDSCSDSKASCTCRASFGNSDCGDRPELRTPSVSNTRM
jgi:hypothetical protein